MAIPTNVITGFLGVGKTTAVLDLLRRKSSQERWAVLVNEYGEVSVDQAILEGEAPSDGVSIREVAGGCVCCVAAPYLQVAIHLLLVEARPDRLIIETTGLGHPSRLIDNLRRDYSDRLEVRSTLTLLSPDDFTTPGMLENPVFREQVELGDILVMNKLDRATPEVVGAFQRWAGELEPEKLLIAASEQGRLEPEWLDLRRPSVSRPLISAEHNAAGIAQVPVEREVPMPTPGQPVRLQSPGSTSACGWIFHPGDVFDRVRLLAFLEKLPSARRLKGIFHTPDDWLVIQRVGPSLTCQPTSYRRDSRLEIFATRAIDWDEIERELREICIST